MKKLIMVALIGIAFIWGTAESQLLNMGVIQGVISDTVETPLASATIWVTPPGTDLDTIDIDFSDALGRFTLEVPLNGQPNSIVDVHAFKTNYVPKDTQDVVVSFGELTYLELELRDLAGPIRGVVWDTTYSSEQIEGVLAFAVREGTADTVFDYTDSYGRYELDVLEAGTYQVNFSHAEYADESYDDINLGYSILTLNVWLDRVIWYVSEGGNDYSGRGSSDRPFATIKWAVDKTSLNDTVLVAPGTYQGQRNRDITVYGDTITIMSQAGPEATLINCEADQSHQARGFDFKDVGPSTTLDGFSIINGYNTSGGAVYCYDDASPTIANCIFKDNEAREGGGAVCVKLRSHAVIRNCRILQNQSSQGAGIIIDDSNPIIEDCVIDSNYASYHGGAIIMDSESNPIIHNCMLNANYSDEIGGGMHILGDCSPLLYNCTIVNNEAGLGPGGGIYCEDELGGNIIVRNCIIRGNMAGGLPSQIDTSEAAPDVIYSDVCDGWEGIGNIDCDPWFCYADSGDYHLAANSDCLGSGEEGTDIGAYGLGCGSAGGIQGWVTLESTGDPLEGATVKATTNTEGLIRIAATGADGYYFLVIPGAPDLVQLECKYPDPALTDSVLNDVNLLVGDTTTVNFALRSGGGYPYLAGDANMFNETANPEDPQPGPWRVGGDVTFLVNFFDVGSGNQPCLIYNPNAPDEGTIDGGYFFASADATGDCQVLPGDVSRLVQYFGGRPDAPILWCGWDKPDPENYFPPLWLNNRDSGLPQPVPALEDLPSGWPNCQIPPTTARVIATVKPK